MNIAPVTYWDNSDSSGSLGAIFHRLVLFVHLCIL